MLPLVYLLKAQRYLASALPHMLLLHLLPVALMMQQEVGLPATGSYSSGWHGMRQLSWRRALLVLSAAATA
jgi:hypothetical protein